ncbi:cyclic nucleotide-binding/CBS domain-containing protein [Bacteroidota bacterium]
MKTAEEIWNEKGRDLITVNTDTTLINALTIMTHNKIGAMLVTKDEKIVGIWTERDLMEDIVDKGCDIKNAKIGDFMTTDLKTIEHTATVYNMLDKYLGMRLRHLIVEKEGKYIGMLSMGDVIRASLLEKTKELDAMSSMVSWEYYEDWKWKSKK